MSARGQGHKPWPRWAGWVLAGLVSVILWLVILDLGLLAYRLVVGW